MQIVAQVASAMQAVFGAKLDEIGRIAGCIRRQRRFSGSSLVRMLVLTLLERPAATDRDYRSAAAKMGVHVTEEAIQHRFTGSLVTFLKNVLPWVVAQTLRARPVTTSLLRKFTEVRIGDSTNLPLPDELADQFPGCGGTGKACRAAMKIQLLWDLVTGELLQFLLEPGRASDALSAIAEALPRVGSLSVLDLGYFAMERFRRVAAAGAYWISRFQHGTTVFDGQGKRLNLLSFLRRVGQQGLVDVPVILGEKERLACRLIAIRVPPESVARRRQNIREKARDHGREPSQEYLDFQEWTVYVTNCPPELLTWKEVVVLYRARWQVELLFKLWKSQNRLAQHETSATPERQMAVLYAKLISVIVQHWLLLTATWNDNRRSLYKAAAILRSWIVLLGEALDDYQRLRTLLGRLQEALTQMARVSPRRKRPSSFQLLENPELLEYIVA